MTLTGRLSTMLVSLACFSIPLFAFADEQGQALTEQRKTDLTHMVKQDCGSCHGMTLKGGLGPALLVENLKNKPHLFITNTILHGRPGTAMPPWKTILTVKEAEWISKQLIEGNFNE